MDKIFNKADIQPQQIAAELQQLLLELRAFRQRLLTLSPEQIWLPNLWHSQSKDRVQQIAEHFTQVYFQPGQDSKETTLLPGAILVDDDLMRQIAQVNAAKGLFKARMQFAKKTLGRSPYLNLVKAVIHPHSISLLQLYRDFRCQFDPLSELKFSWVFKETANVRLTVQGAMKHITEQIENPKIQQDLIHQVAQLGEVEFLYQRQIAPHLQANMKFLTGKTQAKKIHSPLFLLQAEMPLLTQQDLAIEPTALIKTRAPRKDKKSWLRLYAGLNLYYA
ncbi:hypothetical protein THMIRHAS_11910 [Thiosulfatimonas sediminis]|uniref:DNA replication terminus site-binding protein n=1 Tax=Thiosulfatimonas sediminis TaxID=2675054 RepID=A0A6F8PUY3_9GAMM|nr:hypothetical protein [Thiosulfatimonas sediminis]BBP45818.1 hypothetical protein THMIRHAS_11910 [Thiosulfatimonas sediminis]